MYKLLLCWRYLRTRYIALASIVSVMLGVATMIVVNAVMAGFSNEMEDRMHNVLSDVVLESRSMSGFPDPAQHMAAIQQFAGQYIAGMTPTVHVPALLNFQTHGGGKTQRQIVLIGIDENSYATVGDFGKYLQHPANREKLSFELRDGGYDDHDHQSGDNRHDDPICRMPVGLGESSMRSGKRRGGRQRKEFPECQPGVRDRESEVRNREDTLIRLSKQTTTRKHQRTPQSR